MKNVAMGSAAILCGLAMATAAFGFTTSHIATDAELVAMLSDSMFVAEGRIGDRGGAATFELDLGHSTSAPATTAQYPWISGQAEPFSLVYNSGTGVVTFSLGGRTLTYLTQRFQFGDMFVRTRATVAGTSVVVSDLVLEGSPVGDISSAAGVGLDILWISGAALADGFTLTGTAVLTWSATPPTQSNLAFQIKVAELGIVGAEESTWGGIKALYR